MLFSSDLSPEKKLEYRETVMEETFLIRRITCIILILHWIYVVIFTTFLGEEFELFSYIDILGVQFVILLGIIFGTFFDLWRRYYNLYTLVFCIHSVSWASMSLLRVLLCVLDFNGVCGPPTSCTAFQKQGVCINSAVRPILDNMTIYLSFGVLIHLLIFRTSFRALLLTVCIFCAYFIVIYIFLYGKPFVTFIFVIGTYIFSFIISYFQNKSSLQIFTLTDEVQYQIQEKDTAREREKLAEMLRQQFTNYIFHEIRVPLNSIMLSYEMADLDDDARTTIGTGLQSIYTIINDVLDYNKMKDGKFFLQFSPFNYNEAVKRVINSMIITGNVKNVTTIVNLSPDLNLIDVIFDKVRLGQVMSNLYSNAIKFTPSGGTIIIETKVIHINLDEKKITIQTTVSDTGVGIPDKDKSNLFKPFFQVASNKVQSGKGSGLGLAICKNIIDIAKGKITLADNIDHGAVFSFTLELAFQPKQNPESTDTGNVPKTPNRHLNILVVDDNLITLNVMKKLFEKLELDHSTTCAENGQEALDMIKKIYVDSNGTVDMSPQNKFDVIFLDDDMPIMGGKETLTKIREMGLDIPIVSVSGNISTEHEEQYKKLGATFIVGKPLSMKVVRQILDKI